jgi:hypothetical protein
MMTLAALPVEGEVDSKNLTIFGQTNFRDKTTNFGIKLADRAQHMYIVEQTGTGKTTVMKSMALDDIAEGSAADSQLREKPQPKTRAGQSAIWTSL